MKTFKELFEKKLTPAELKKREEIAKAMERENPGMDMGKKMAIATAAAKRAAKETELDEATAFSSAMKKAIAAHERGDKKRAMYHLDNAKTARYTLRSVEIDKDPEMHKKYKEMRDKYSEKGGDFKIKDNMVGNAKVVSEEAEKTPADYEAMAKKHISDGQRGTRANMVYASMMAGRARRAAAMLKKGGSQQDSWKHYQGTAIGEAEKKTPEQKLQDVDEAYMSSDRSKQMFKRKELDHELSLKKSNQKNEGTEMLSFKYFHQALVEAKKKCKESSGEMELDEELYYQHAKKLMDQGIDSHKPSSDAPYGRTFHGDAYHNPPGKSRLHVMDNGKKVKTVHVPDEHIERMDTKGKLEWPNHMDPTIEKHHFDAYAKTNAKHISEPVKESVEVEEALKGDMHPRAGDVLKNIKPEHHDKYKPYLKNGVYKGNYADRSAVLRAAEKAGHTVNEAVSPFDWKAYAKAKGPESSNKTKTFHDVKKTSTGTVYTKQVNPDGTSKGSGETAAKAAEVEQAPKRGRGRPAGVGAKTGSYKPRDPAKKAASAAKAAASKAANRAARNEEFDNEFMGSLIEGFEDEDFDDFLQCEEFDELDEATQEALINFINEKSCGSYKMKESLTGKQHKLDKNKNGKIDSHDFKLLRKEETEQIQESVDVYAAFLTKKQ